MSKSSKGAIYNYFLDTKTDVKYPSYNHHEGK